MDSLLFPTSNKKSKIKCTLTTLKENYPKIKAYEEALNASYAQASFLYKDALNQKLRALGLGDQPSADKFHAMVQQLKIKKADILAKKKEITFQLRLRTNEKFLSGDFPPVDSLFS